MPGADGDRLNGYIMMIRDKAVPLSLRGVRSDGSPSDRVYKTPKRTKRQMYQRQVMIALPYLPV